MTESAPTVCLSRYWHPAWRQPWLHGPAEAARAALPGGRVPRLVWFHGTADPHRLHARPAGSALPLLIADLPTYVQVRIHLMRALGGKRSQHTQEVVGGKVVHSHK